MQVNQIGKELSKDIKDAIKFFDNVWKANSDIYKEIMVKEDHEEAIREAEILYSGITLLRSKIDDYNTDAVLAGRLLRSM